MYLINNQPILDLSQYVDLDSLLEMKPYLDYAVVMSSSISSPSQYSTVQLFDKNSRGVLNVLDDYLDNIDKKSKEFPFLKELKDTDKLCRWLCLHENLVYGQQSVQIIYMTDWKTKHLSKHCIKTDNIKYFQPFFDWLDKQNIFSDYGRTVVFLNEPLATTPTHFDGYGNRGPNKDQFVWFGLDDRKKLYVLDNDTNTKHYLTSQVGIFESANYHGADPSDLANWSLRVDGVFSDSFLAKTGLTEHFKK